MQITKLGAARFDIRDPYYSALTISWPSFVLALFITELAINILFALLYSLQPGCIANVQPGSLTDAFFFSIETLATVGYGVMAPATLYGHIVSALEIVTGMTFTALFTGLIFVRFSRPKAKIMFADQAVVTRYNGKPTLMIRIANGRLTPLVDAKATLTALITERSAEGSGFRTSYELTLKRSRLHIFPLTWTLMHEIDELSPLSGATADSLALSNTLLMLSVTALDYAIGAEVRNMRSYEAHDLAFNMRYQDAVTIGPDGRSIADLRRLHLVEPDATPASAA